MPTIDEAIERACAAYAAHVGETIFEDGMRAAISAFLADVPVSDGMRRKGANAFMDGGGDSRFADAYKAMSAKLAKEIQ